MRTLMGLFCLNKGLLITSICCFSSIMKLKAVHPGFPGVRPLMHWPDPDCHTSRKLSSNHTIELELKFSSHNFQWKSSKGRQDSLHFSNHAYIETWLWSWSILRAILLSKLMLFKLFSEILGSTWNHHIFSAADQIFILWLDCIPLMLQSSRS